MHDFMMTENDARVCAKRPREGWKNHNRIRTRLRGVLGKLGTEIAAFGVHASDDEATLADRPGNLNDSSLLLAREHCVLARVSIDEETSQVSLPKNLR